MPNCCTTDVIISHPDAEKIKMLFDKITEWTSKDFIPGGFGFGHGWLGNVVGFSGIDVFKNGEFEHTSCRGCIGDFEIEDDNEIRIHQDDAWTPHVGLWKKVIDKYLPDAKIDFTADEPGNNLYVTTDDYLIGLFRIDIWGESEYKNYDTCDDSVTEVVELLQKLLHTEENDVEILLEMYENNGGGATYDIFINEWQKGNICDYM